MASRTLCSFCKKCYTHTDLGICIYCRLELGFRYERRPRKLLGKILAPSQ